MWSDPALRRLGAVVAVIAATVVLATDRPAPPATRTVLDPFTSAADDIADLRARGVSVGCRLRIAVWEPDRPDAARFPPSSLGPPTGVATGERWLHPRAWPSLAPVFADRLRLCRDKGFDTVVLVP